MTGGSGEWALTGTTLKEVTVRATARGREVVVERVTATDGEGGRIKGKGRLLLRPTAGFPVTGRLDWDVARLIRREDARVDLGGKLTLEGGLRQVLIGGELEVKRADLLLPEPSGEELPVIAVEDPEALAEAAGSSGGNSSGEGISGPRLQLRVAAPGRLFVRGRGLESEWSGNLTVTGGFAAPWVAGEVTVKRGEIDLLGNKFILRRGVVTLGGALPPDPVLDLEADSEGRDFTVVARLTGAVSQPEFSLTSDPEMVREEILSRLLFDRGTDSMTPGQAVKLAMALQQFQGGGLGVVGGLRQGLGIDRLDFGGDTAETGSVKVGKYLNDTIYMEVQRGLAADSGRVKVEIELTPQLSIETGVDSRSNADVNLQWKKGY
ncbi:MAG: translocation/assembly module TamB [Magnetococcales bacterium]|nr:translocation/assembly module TamB [Magnetococcales bacterium]